ncbi:MAG: hypothetical protein U0175_11540 [Caldilineaceae bacterium]
MTIRTDQTVNTDNWVGGAVTSGIVSLIVNLIVAWVISLIVPTSDLNWALTLVAITSFFAGFFGYYGASRARPAAYDRSYDRT